MSREQQHDRIKQLEAVQDRIVEGKLLSVEDRIACYWGMQCRISVKLAASPCQIPSLPAFCQMKPKASSQFKYLLRFTAPPYAAVLAERSLDCWHTSPLHIGLESLLIGKPKRNSGSMDMDTSTYIKLQEEFRRLHTAGLTFRRMAEVLGISERTVTAWRKELDLPRRPRGRRPRKSRKSRK
jgi:hypothetical protein